MERNWGCFESCFGCGVPATEARQKQKSGATIGAMIRLCKDDWYLLLGAGSCLIVAAIGQSYVPTLTGRCLGLCTSVTN